MFCDALVVLLVRCLFPSFAHALNVPLCGEISIASNTFFLQFPNCLAYETKKECVEKIKFALENAPTPLSPEDRHKLTWEGANKRLFESSLMTEAEAEERNKKTGDFARLHMDTMKTGAFFQGLWSRGSHKKVIIKEEKEPEAIESEETKEKPLIGICSPKVSS